MYNYGVGYVWSWVRFGVRYGWCLGEMLTFWGGDLLTFGVNFRVRIRLFTVGISGKLVTFDSEYRCREC